VMSWFQNLLSSNGSTCVPLPPGNYSLVCVPPAAKDEPFVHRLVVGASEWRAMSPPPPGIAPPNRFKPAAAAAGDAFVLFGGAGEDQGYLGDAWVLPAAADAVSALGFRKTITVAHASAGAGLSASTVRVAVNTAELVDAARLGPSCADIRFEAPANGGGNTATVLTHWLDPRPGCGASKTVFWVRLPAGTLGAATANTTLHVSYGNPAWGEAFAAAAAKKVGGHVGGWPGPPPAGLFELYEGFETTNASSSFTPVAACGVDKPEPSAFRLSSPSSDDGGVAAAGSGALAATGTSPGAVAAPLSTPLTSYIVQAWFWDSAAVNASHSLGVAANACPSGLAASPAAGVYTAAAADSYAAAPPWRTIGAKRSAGWTLFEIAVGGGEGVFGVKRNGGGEVTAGGAARATPAAAAAAAAPLSRVVLSTGLGANGRPAPVGPCTS
jgi:hypothetical protein